jgi:hypothetical protein
MTHYGPVIAFPPFADGESDLSVIVQLNPASLNTEVTKQVLPSLWKFIDYYGYRDVRRFISRYETVAFPDLKR